MQETPSNNDAVEEEEEEEEVEEAADHSFSDGESNASDDPMSSEDEAEEEEPALDAKVTSLRKQVEEQPYNIQARLELIKELRAKGDFEELQAARHACHDQLPLPPAAWMEWIEDEWNMAENTAERKAVLQLFHKAFEEIFSVPLALEYCHKYQAIQGEEEKGVEEQRREMLQVWQETAQWQGSHYAEGGVLWSEYRAFLQTLTGDDVIGSIRQSYHQQLSIPMRNATQVLAEYLAWETDEAQRRQAQDIYDKVQADEMAELRAEWEQQVEAGVANNITQRWSIWREYVREEPDDTIRLPLYLRAITDRCLPTTDPKDTDNQIEFLLQFLALLKTLRPQLLKPWSKTCLRLLHCGELWVHHLHVLEECQSSFEEGKLLFDDIFIRGMPNMVDYAQAFLEFLGYCRRSLEANVSQETRDAIAEHGRNAVQKAIAFFGHYQDQDTIVTVVKLWVHIEEITLHSQGCAQKLFRQVLALMPQNYNAWCDFAAFLAAQNHLDEARQMYEEALAAMPQSVYCRPVAADWKLLEWRLGTLSTLRHCLSGCRSRIASLHRQEEVTRESSPPHTKKEKSIPKVQEGKAKAKAKAKDKVHTAQSLKAKIIEVKEQQARQQLDRRRKLKETKGQVSRTISKGPSLEDIVEETATEVTKTPPPPSDVEDMAKRDAVAAEITTDEPAKKKSKGDETGWKPEGGKEKRTAFIWNLPWDKSDEDLRDWLQYCDVEAVHIVRNKRGASLGYAYVTMANDRSLLKAFSFDKRYWEKRQVRVQQFDGCKTPKEFRDKGNQLVQEEMGVKTEGGEVPQSADQPVNPYLTAAPEPIRGAARYLQRHKRGGFLAAPRAVLLRQPSKCPPLQKPEGEMTTAPELNDEPSPTSAGEGQELKTENMKDQSFFRHLTHTTNPPAVS